MLERIVCSNAIFVEVCMEFLYPFLIAFIMVFIAELGDKTQLLVLSFAGGVKTRQILFGIAIGSFFSHGIAILFGSRLGLLQNAFLHTVIEIITYVSFILIGILSLVPKKVKMDSDSKKDGIMKRILHLKINYALIIALSIIVGELGDKTFLASLGFGIQYPNHKFLLVVGAICGMLASDSLAIVSGKFLSKYIPEDKMQKISGILFLLFGVLGFVFA